MMRHKINLFMNKNHVKYFTPLMPPLFSLYIQINTWMILNYSADIPRIESGPT